jgi:glutathione S-transferase
MNSLQLYTFGLCPSAHRVRLALAEKNLPAEQIEIDLKNKPAEFLSLSPYGRVPLLIHDGFRVWESAIILEYLEEAFPQYPLMPTEPAARAAARLWIEFANNRLFAATHDLIFTTDMAIRRQRVVAMEDSIRYLEREALGKPRRGPYLLGESYTYADIALYPWFEQVASFERFSDFRMPADCTGARAWQAAVAARPATRNCARPDDWYAEGYQRYLAA